MVSLIRRSTQWLTVRARGRRRANWRGVALDAALPLFVYSLSSLALTWPLIRDFTGRVPGSSFDVYHNIWAAWHVKEALLGHEPLFSTQLLYYPTGISLLLHGIGPLTALFALPLWPWGPVVAYNGMILVSFVLTGVFMYLLARGLAFDRPVALLAGILLLAAPMHLIGVRGHMEKVFIGLLPLGLLTLHHALDLNRSHLWSVVFTGVLLLTLLHNGLQFLLAVLSAIYFIGWALIAGPFGVTSEAAKVPGYRRRLFGRVALMAGSALILVGPLLLAIVLASGDPAIRVDFNRASLNYAPDLVEFFLPPAFSNFFGSHAKLIYDRYAIRSTIETAVYLSWTALLLSAIALIGRRKRALPWLVFTLLWVILALGPKLQILGRHTFSEYQLPVILPPYVLLTALPGLEFLRTPGRLMLAGYVGLAISASFGLAWLRWRFRRAAHPLAVIAIALLLLETWPEPWWQQTLRPTPAFYQAIASDPERYGVLDLPLKPWWAGSHVDYSARYQMDQMTHRKGIALGYISRTYRQHPLFPCLIPERRRRAQDVLVNGRPSRCFANTLFDLASANYRYVVWHKPQADDHFTDEPGQYDETSSYILSLFEGREPLVDDALTTVYAVPPPAEAAALMDGPVLGLLNNWYGREEDTPTEGSARRWAKSPASLWLSLPRQQQMLLEITPAAVAGPGPESTGREGRLLVEVSSGFSTSVMIRQGITATIPLDLPAGAHIITLALAAGNFRPADYGGEDERLLGFAIRRINLAFDK